MEENKFLTLKEAAQISGYAPDYIGQLIRKGKLPGKQVYTSFAWMISEQDLKNYMSNARQQQEKQTNQKSGTSNKLLYLLVGFGLLLILAIYFLTAHRIL
jgi:hypothetical protein